MPSADDRAAGESGQQPPPWWPGMPAAVPGLPFNVPAPGGAGQAALPANLPAGAQPPVWNSDLGVAFTALWAAGFQAGQQMANPGAAGATGAAGAAGAAGAVGAAAASVPAGAVPGPQNAAEIGYHQVARLCYSANPARAAPQHGAGASGSGGSASAQRRSPVSKPEEGGLVVEPAPKKRQGEGKQPWSEAEDK